MKRMMYFALSMAVLLLLSACGGNDTGNEGGNGGKEFLTIATGGTGGTYYPLGGALASIINNDVDNTQSNVESTGGAIANLKLIASDEAQIAFVSADSAYYAYTGTEFFEGEEEEHKDLRVIGSLYPEVIQLVTSKKSGIKSIDDLVGEKVAVGDAGSGTELSARITLDAYGISYDDIQEDFLDFGEVTTGIQDGNIAAGFVWAGIPTSSIVDLASLNDIDILPIESEKMSNILNEYPFYNEIIIPADTYKGQEEDVPTIAANALLVTSANVDEDTIYEITKYLFEKTDEITASHVRGEDITLDTALDGVSTPLHKGSIKYFEEVGVEVPEEFKE